MATHNHKRLTLQRVQLGPGEQWNEPRDKLSFIFPRTGKGKLGLALANRSLVPGDVLVLNGKTGVQLATQSKTGMAFWTFFLSLEDLFPLFTCLEILLLPAVRESLGQWKHFPAGSVPAVESHKMLVEASPQFHLGHRSQLLGAAAIILDEEFKRVMHAREGVSRVEDHTIKVLDELSLEQMLGLPIGELAAKFGCSRRHLNRTFNHQFGMSVAAVRLELRLLKAAALLRNPEAKVINVGLECGFNHSGLFNLCFKRRFGCTPGKWREQEAANLSPDPTPVPVECTLHRVGLCPLGASPESSRSKAQASHALGNGGTALALAAMGMTDTPKASERSATTI